MKKNIKFLLFILVVEAFVSTIFGVTYPSESFGSDLSSSNSNSSSSYLNNSSVENNNVYSDPNADLQSQDNVNTNNLGNDTISTGNAEIKVIKKGSVSVLCWVYSTTNTTLGPGSSVYIGIYGPYKLSSTGYYNGETFTSTESGGLLYVVDDGNNIIFTNGGGGLVNILPISDAYFFIIILLFSYGIFLFKRKKNKNNLFV